MYNIFKSRTRKRTEKKIREIQGKIESLNIDANQRKIKRTLTPQAYSQYYVKLQDYKQDIELLKSLL